MSEFDEDPIGLTKKFAAAIGYLFPQWDLIDRFKAAADCGFDGVELALPYEVQAEKLEAARLESGMEVLLFTAPLGDFLEGGEGNACVPGMGSSFQDSLAISQEYAEALDSQYVQFVAGRCFDKDARTAYLATYSENLCCAAQAFEAGKTKVIVEAINSRDFPGYLLPTPQQTRALIKATGRTDIGAVLDTVHAAAMDVDICEEVQLYGADYAHLQLADEPGRCAPGSGELDFDAILAAISISQYSGWLGMEYRSRSGEEAETLARFKQRLTRF